MNAQDRVNDQVFAEIKRLCYAGLDAAKLRQRVAERLRRSIPFDASVAFTMDPTTGLVTDALVDQMGDERALRFFLEHIYLEDDIFDFSHIARNRTTVNLLSEATSGKLERSLGYRELQAPLGWGHEMKAVFTTGTQLWGGLCLTREKGRPDFAPCDVALVHRIAHHVGAGLRAATLQQDLDDEREGDDAAGVLVLNQRGSVVQHNPAAERRLRELGELDAQWREGKGLPQAIWMVLGALHCALQPESDHDLNRAPELHVRGLSGRWLTLQASQTEASLTRPSETVVVIGPSAPRQVLTLTASSYGLSRREQEVVDLVVRGVSTKQIAQTLYISAYTVKDHLDHIFEKVGVRGRRALVKRLYLNTIAP